MMKKVKVILYKNSDCDLCKLQHEELVNNPPDGDVIIKHVKHPNTKKEAEIIGISSYPCIILLDTDTMECVHRFYGFTPTDIINFIIKQL